MIKIGEYNTLKVIRENNFGYFLDAGTDNTNDDVLLHISNVTVDNLEIGDEVEVFVYRDSNDRITATMKRPIAVVGDIVKLEVVAKTSIGSFVSIGLERDVLVPFKEETYPLEKGQKYLFCIYLDKTGRIAATTRLDKHLLNDEEEVYKTGDEVNATVYGFQTNDSVMVAIDNKFRGVILHNEYYTSLNIGDEIKVRVKKHYEDFKLGVTPRQVATVQRETLEGKIIEFLKSNNGFMKYNDKSNPDEIKSVFKESKNYFKRALGGLMKKGLITQDEKGTYLK